MTVRADRALPRRLPNGRTLSLPVLWLIAFSSGMSGAVVLKFGVIGASALFFTTAHLGSPLLVICRASFMPGLAVSALEYAALSGAAIAAAFGSWWLRFTLRRVWPVSAALTWGCIAGAAAAWCALVFPAARTVWHISWWAAIAVAVAAASLGGFAAGPCIDLFQTRRSARTALAGAALVALAALAIAGQYYRGYGDTLQVSHRVDISMAHVRSRGPSAWRRVFLDDYHADDMNAIAVDAAAEYKMWPDDDRLLRLGEALALAQHRTEAASVFRAVLAATSGAPVGAVNQRLRHQAEQDLRSVQE